MDYVIHAMAADNQIRVFVATTKELVEKARQIHRTAPTATAALGRFLTAGVLMGSMIKEQDELLTIQIKSEGDLGGMTVSSALSKDEQEKAIVNVKGYAFNPDADLPLREDGKLDVSGIVGKGMLYVVRDTGLKAPFVGQTELVSGEIAEDLTYYYANSEQVPSSVGLGVLLNEDDSIKAAGGFMIQLLPFATDEVITNLENKLTSMPSLSKLLAQGMTPEAILADIFGEGNYTIHEQFPAQFYCNCNKQRVEKALISLPDKDIDEMIADNRPIEVNCHFCNKTYKFDTKELTKIKKNR